MSFLDYLDEHRGQFIDHRALPPACPALSAAEAAELAGTDVIGGGADGDHRSGARRRRARSGRPDIRFRHLRPAFSPSPYSDPLPYEEPWERVFR